jgi:hypothetical protein
VPIGRCASRGVAISHVKMSVFCLTFRKNHGGLVCLHSTEKIIVHIGTPSVDRITSEISSILSAS